MTTRHTLTHADKVYRGNAFYGGYSPDGRRGVEQSHLYHRDYGAVAADDPDGLVTKTAFTSGVATVTVALTSGAALVSTAGAGVFDVPRNFVFHVSETPANATYTLFKITGVDEYGATMTDRLNGASANDTVSGLKAFKSITKVNYTVTAAAICSGKFTVGSGPRLGLPFWIKNQGQVLGGYVSGLYSTGLDTVAPGTSQTATETSAVGAKDVRGTYTFKNAYDASKRYGVLLTVDASTRNKAFGPVQCAT